MTAPTKEQCVQWARECGASFRMPKHDLLQLTTDQLHAFALKVLAEKELEVLKLLEALEEVSALINESCGVYGLHLNGDPAPWDELLQGGRYERLGLLQETLSTPPSTEALDEYVAARMAESEDRRDAERYRWLRDFDNTELYASWISQKLNDPETVEPFDFDEAIDAAIERSE